MARAALVATVCLLAARAAAQPSALRVPGPLSPRTVAYTIDATLDANRHLVTASGRLTWRNDGTAPATELVFHLDLDAFKNERSAFFVESRGRHRTSDFDGRSWGALDLDHLVIDGEELAGRVRVADTVATVPLSKPVAPGATVTVELSWRALLPAVFARTGFHERFFAIAQWYPKLAVWDCAPSETGCRWRAHPLHLNSEFFGEYGTFEVTFRAPRELTVAASGVLVGEEATGDTRLLRFRAEDVHDFALAAAPDFEVTRAEVDDGGPAPVEVLLYSLPGREENRPRHLAAAHAGLVELGRRLGRYPYRRLSIVDVPRGAEGAGGMEYPTLFFTIDLPVPAGVRAPESVTLHELAHQWFYGVIGSDEAEEAWLDEGLTDAAEGWAMAAYTGEARPLLWDLFGHHATQAELRRLEYREAAWVDPLAARSWDYRDNYSYGAISYGKTMLALATVEGIVGRPRFEAGLRRYADGWRFRHPRRADFVAAFDAGVGEDLTWLWRPVLEGTDTVDYLVSEVESTAHRAPAGLFDRGELDGGVPDGAVAVDGGGGRVLVPVPPEEAKAAVWDTSVVVERKGALALPVDVRVVFADGSVRTERWDGGRSDGSAWHRFTYRGAQEVSYAVANPEGAVALDLSRWNDGLRAAPDPGPRERLQRRLGRWLAALLAAVGP